MGDLPPSSRPQALDGAATGPGRDGNPNMGPTASSSYPISDSNAPFYSQLSSIPQNQSRSDYRSSSQLPAPYVPQEHGVSPLNMGSMAGNLPDYASVEDPTMSSQAHQSAPRSLPGASATTVAYQLGQNVPMHANLSNTVPNHPSYGNSFPASPYQQAFPNPQGPQHHAYNAYGANQSRMHGGSSMQPSYHNYPQAGQYVYYPTPYGHQGPFNPAFIAQGAQNQAMYGRRESIPGGPAGPYAEHLHHEGNYGGARTGGLQGDAGVVGPGFGAQFAQVPGMHRPGPVSSVPRGPPRKPKQSGHALWVGNLPPGTTVVALKDHFSREATKEIESLFLISKSNCAFVNYRTEASCTAAMHRFHDSRFNGVRLVCRLRRSSAPASGVPTGPSAMVGSQQAQAASTKPQQVDGETVEEPQEQIPEPETQAKGEEGAEDSHSANKYFIVKSLTLQDLELSVRNGIWATQSHNEDVLNKAFQAAENVYLIFSANKSGEYFGYARMTSPILEDGSRVVATPPKPESIVDTTDVPKSIPTPATEWAPRGKIIDDSARGTIFWEAELSDSDGEEEATEKADVQVDGDTSPVAQSWGKPFKIEWVSTNRLPFYRTRGLRNPWNANREVKIARDGTELEPSIGERLVQMFHRMGPPNAGGPMMPQPPPYGGPNLAQMRPY